MMNDLGHRLEILAKSLQDRVILNQAAMLARQLMEERTLQGKFLRATRAEYSEAYAERRRARGLQTSHVDLQFSGAMWGSFSHEVDVNDLLIEIGFNREELARIASYHDIHGAGKNRVIREFMGLTDRELQIIHDFFLRKIGKKIDFLLEKNLPGYK